jgi:hypothetical protein
MEQELIDRAIRFLAQYRDSLVTSYSSTRTNGTLHLMTLEECSDGLDEIALQDIASLDELIREMMAHDTVVRRS